jgi:hypothetical protein
MNNRGWGMGTRGWILTLALAIAGCGEAGAGVRSIWAVNDGEKIAHDNLGSPLKTGNSVWDGHTIRLLAARNEIVAFQIVVEADAGGITAMSAGLPEVRIEGGDARITYRQPGSDPTNYAGSPIQIYSVRDMFVKKPTAASWIYLPGSPSAPKNPAGWKPVQLVPENARTGRGGFPLHVAPSSNQVLWFEIYTGRGRPAGKWRGTVSVRTDGNTQNLPLELELLDFDLPDQNSIRAMVYFETAQLGLYHGRNLEPEYHRFAHRNRIELVHAYGQEEVQVSIGRLNGEDFAAARGYEGPGERVGNTIVPRTFYGPGKEFDEKASAWKAADAWITFLETRLPKALTFVYLPDEPSPKQFPYIRRLGENLHSNPGPGRPLRTMVTRRYTPEIEDAIDIWNVPPEGYDIARAKQQREKGRETWVYNGGRPWGGAVVIDAPATDARALIWGCFKHEIPVYFYWHANHWRHNMQKVGNRIQNVWADTVTFDNRGQPNKPIDDQNFANGDGVLVYPGEEKLHPDEDRGIAGPVSTVQLANLRRGLQDHLYLTMARKLGMNDVVEKALRAAVPRMFSDAGKEVGFAEQGDVYELARREVARAIAQSGSRPR